MLDFCFSDLLDLSADDHYQLQEILTAQTCSDDYDQDPSDYFSVAMGE